jgi:hypothetical protein
MGNYRSLLLYSEDALYGTVLKLVLLIVPTTFTVIIVYLWSNSEHEGSIALFTEGVLIGIIFLSILPRKYQIYDDQLRIVLGGPFSIKLGFEKIAKIEVTNKTLLTANFVTRVARFYVRIVRKKGLDIAITPKSNEEFVDRANRALNDWERTRFSNIG